MKCGNCRCWRRSSESREEKYGVCHRFPPTSAERVEIHETDWCMEFFPKTDEHGHKDYTY